MSKLSTTITVEKGRVRVQCAGCDESMETPDNEFGARMVVAFHDVHKCYKPKRARS